MEKRRFDKLGIETSLLGFGCMRFPLREDGSIDEELAEKMLDLAMASGVNYYDTAYPYHNGDSEPFLGKVLDKYDRASYYLATKLPVWKLETPEDTERIFNEQLARLHKGYVDFYLLHALNSERFDKLLELGVIEACERLKAEGKIKYLGFSFHDNYEVFERILTYRDWDFCQIQYNYMDTDEQAGDKGYALAKKMGVPMVIMEPVKGGSLASLPEEIAVNFKEFRPKQSIASWEKKIPAYIVDSRNLITIPVETSFEIRKEEQFGKYVSFFPLEKEVASITLEGFAYPLDHHYLPNSSGGLCVSNEIVEETAHVSYEGGILLMVQSRD